MLKPTIHSAVSEPAPSAGSVAAARSPLRPPEVIRHDLVTKDLGMSTVAALSNVDRCIATMASDVMPSLSLVDLGAKYGTLGAYVAARLGLHDVIAIDRFENALDLAAAEGARTILADLATDLPLPIDAESAAVVTSFGAIEHLPWFDELLLEAHRLLAPNGWLLLSTPNLASYLNRAALLAGYQPRDVEIARRFTPGILPSYRTEATRKPLGHPHVATLRAMKELLTMTGFDVISVYGFGPRGPGTQKVLDALVSRFPSLCRRVLMLARKKASAERG